MIGKNPVLKFTPRAGGGISVDLAPKIPRDRVVIRPCFGDCFNATYHGTRGLDVGLAMHPVGQWGRSDMGAIMFSFELEELLLLAEEMGVPVITEPALQEAC